MLRTIAKSNARLFLQRSMPTASRGFATSDTWQDRESLEEKKFAHDQDEQLLKKLAEKQQLAKGSAKAAAPVGQQNLNSMREQPRHLSSDPVTFGDLSDLRSELISKIRALEDELHQLKGKNRS